MDTKARLRQASTDRKIAIDAADKEIARLEALIAEEAKPELDYGEVVIARSGAYLVIFKDRDGEAKSYSATFLYDPGADGCQNLYTRTPHNIKDYFADLKRNQEDLREFSISDNGGSLVMSKSENFPNQIQFDTTRDKATMSIGHATEIHQKLGQIIATAKRDASK